MKPDHPDSLSFPATCQHCAALLQPRDRFCPLCGENRYAPAGVGRAESIGAFERAASDELDTLSPLEEDDGVPPRHKTRGTHAAYLSVAGSASTEDAGGGKPAFWQTAAPESGRGPWFDALSAIQRLGLSIAAVLLLLGGVLAIDAGRSGRLDPDTRLQVDASNLAQVRGALGRGDLGVAEAALTALEVDHANDPDVQQLRTALDLRTREQARREQLREAARKAVQALGLSEPAAPEPAATAPRSPAAVAQETAVVRDAAPDPMERPCSEALAALSLCAAKAATPPPGPDAPKPP